MARDREGGEIGKAELDRLIEEIIADSHGDGEQLWAFRQALEDKVERPCDIQVIGETVSLIGFDFDGNERRGLTARCRKRDGAEHIVAAWELVAPPGSTGARYLAAYRRWLGVDTLAGRRRRRSPAATKADPDALVELAILSIGEGSASCRVLDRGSPITLRATELWDRVPGEIVVVRPSRKWSYAGHPYLSAQIESSRVDAGKLGLVPLRLEDRGTWDPLEEYEVEEGEPVVEWAEPIIRRGPRPAYEMEQVIPGADPEDDTDPIIESTELRDMGRSAECRKMLMELCKADLRCLDAHAHLGSLNLDARPEVALRHYEVGVRIGELSLGQDFDGVLGWGHLDNRPFLRCLHGLGLSLWRRERFEEAAAVFDRLLWLSPLDELGVRFVIGDARTHVPWHDDAEVP